MKYFWRWFYRFALPFRRAYWFIFRPVSCGVKTLVEFEGKFLLIKNTYGHKRWSLPGGHKEKNETPEAAAKRETLEEVGIKLDRPICLGTYFSDYEYKKITVYCYWEKVSNPFFRIDNYEVGEAAWFAADSLPGECVPSLAKVIGLYKNLVKK